MGNKLVIKAPVQVMDLSYQFKGSENLRNMELTVTREGCVDPRLLNSFLRAMRHNSDDVIREKLNNVKDLTTHEKRARCQDFVHNELSGNWRIRDKVISFCENESSQLKTELDQLYAQNVDASQATVSARMDPYAPRAEQMRKDLEYGDWQRLDAWVKNQREVESILQKSAVSVLNTRCDPNIDYMTQFDDLRRSL
ncbi:LAMI_0F09032g1_1 [Lachancea mirantina]|uniref:LAMI_0F09032g1_1 n=1 Tax=Lachancea mirantina TaxID=1230905 RepID=A0A1G4K0T6_9SACH|nr:LAMI_0F09032g1_1 [Lachancea mirantina]